MKELFYLSLGLWLLVAGCLKPIPPEPTVPVLIEVRRLPPEIKGEIFEEEDAGPPIKTWLSKEEMQEQLRKQEELRKEQEDPCSKGDPLCDVIP